MSACADCGSDFLCDHCGECREKECRACGCVTCGSCGANLTAALDDGDYCCDDAERDAASDDYEASHEGDRA